MTASGDTTFVDTADRVDYAHALTLLGQVIGLFATAIARERSRSRPDHDFIARMERQRHEAVEVCRRLTSADPESLVRAVREYAAVHDTLRAMTRHG
jgi:uncharacterized membrane protein YccC